MLQVDLLQVLIETAIACLFFMVFAAVGNVFLKNLFSLFLKEISSLYGQLFWSFLADNNIDPAIIAAGISILNLLFFMDINFLYDYNYLTSFLYKILKC